MYAFARRPLWVLSHLAVVALILAMVWASTWQWSRRTAAVERNARIEARTAEPVEDLSDLLTLATTAETVEMLEFRPVEVTGEFVRPDEVLVRNRPQDGAPGSWALTPLRLSDGTAVLVNRGWVPRRFTPDGPRNDVDPPEGLVTVTGWVRPTEVRQGLQAGDAPTGVLTSVARPDIARIQQQVDYELLPGFVQMEQIDAEPPDLPAPLALPELTEGSHASYAVQWAIFSLIGAIGYPLILRRVARGNAGSHAGGDVA